MKLRLLRKTYFFTYKGRDKNGDTLNGSGTIETWLWGTQHEVYKEIMIMIMINVENKVKETNGKNRFDPWLTKLERLK